MKHHFRRHTGTSILAFLTITLLATVGIPSRSTQESAEDAVRNVLTQTATAFQRGDMAAMEKLWANDESVIVFESGHANYGWADYRDRHLGPEIKEMQNTKY